MKKKSIIFILLLVISSLLVAGTGYAINHFLLLPLGIEREEHPIALPFVLLTDEILQAQVERKLEAMRNPPRSPAVTEPPVTEAMPAPTEVPTEAPTEPPTEPLPVEDGWFDDALFIGESRIEGLKLYSRLGEADYFSAVSMTVFGVLDARLSDEDFSGVTLDELLNSRDYGKVYIHLGINEVPVGAEGIFDGYMKVIERVRTLEPDAVIVLLGCMSITETYCARVNFDMNTIHTLNEKLKALADSVPETYRYIDTNAWAADERGFLRPEITFDGCHLYAEYYGQWCNRMKEEAAGYAIP